MKFVESIGRAGAALVLLSACGAEPLTAAAAEASTPAPIWRDVARVNVLCLVQTDAGVDHGRLRDSLCESVRAGAGAGATVPVRIIQLGDPAVLSPDSVTLLFHGLIQNAAPGRELVFSIRPYRASSEALLFTAAPRAVPLGAASAPAPQLKAALAAALSETLPWLSRPAGARPIR